MCTGGLTLCCPTGVAGLSLGGGYSWKTDQFGLTVDTIVSHHVVLPAGQQVQASEGTNPDLFFGLRGGFNNFGIVTNITLRAHSQTLVFVSDIVVGFIIIDASAGVKKGGHITYAPDAVVALSEAISNFQANNTDPKAQIVAQFASSTGQVTYFRLRNRFSWA